MGEPFPAQPVIARAMTGRSKVPMTAPRGSGTGHRGSSFHPAGKGGLVSLPIDFRGVLGLADAGMEQWSLVVATDGKNPTQVRCGRWEEILLKSTVAAFRVPTSCPCKHSPHHWIPKAGDQVGGRTKPTPAFSQCRSQLHSMMCKRSMQPRARLATAGQSCRISSWGMG